MKDLENFKRSILMNKKRNIADEISEVKERNLFNEFTVEARWRLREIN